MSPPLSELQREIMAYFRDHEHAAETAAGISRVWLDHAGASGDDTEVEVALDGLVALGLVEKHALPGTGFVYRRRVKRLNGTA